MDRISNQTLLGDALEALSKPETAKDYYWVHAMLLTTLIPTLVHFAIAGASLTLWLPQQWRHRIANNLEKNHYKLWAASFYLTFTPIIGLFAPIALLYGLYLLVTAHGGWLGGVLLKWANLLAGVIV